MRRKRYFAVLLVVAVFACFSFGGIMENADAAAKRKTVNAPARVTGLKAISRDKTAASVMWKRVKKVSGYKVYLSSKSAKKGFKLAKTIKKNKTVRTTLKKLKANKKYYVKVRAFVKYKQGVKKYYNVKTKKWQTKKPTGKAWKGKKKTFKVTKYKYGKYSKVLKLGVYKVNQEDRTNTDSSKNDNTPTNETDSKYKKYTIKGPTTMIRGQEATFSVDAPASSIKKLTWYSSRGEFIKEDNGLSIKVKIPEDTNCEEFDLQLSNNNEYESIWWTNEHTVKIALDPNLTGTIVEKTSDSFHVFSNGIPKPDGKVDIEYKIKVKGGSNWTKNNYKINVTEVTPKAYKELYRQLGYSDEMTYSVDYTDTLWKFKTYDGYGYGYYTGKAQPCTTIKITIHANAARVFKITEASGKALPDVYDDNGELETALESKYVAPQYYNDDYDPATFYNNLYDKARKRLEAKLWTDDMTNLQKLSIISNYINATTHYPGTKATSKELNRAYWEEHAIDGKELFYNALNMPRLNKAMKLQGGITTCVAQSILIDVAEDDLGLPYLYNKEQDKVLDGEGVWTGMGSYSTNPSNPYHETCYYKDATENKYAFDVQGLFSPCSEHNCKSIIVPLD